MSDKEYYILVKAFQKGMREELAAEDIAKEIARHMPAPKFRKFLWDITGGITN